jgi:N-acetylglucosaminyldiphosphoundecaprenol N-acetyl-beta-D-mannosaminyltransferase
MIDMKNMQLLQALVGKILVVPDEATLAPLLERLRAEAAGRPVRVAFVNAHAVNLACNDPAFLADLLACDYVFRDGSGMKILYRWLGRDPGLNLNGTDLIPRIVDLYRGQTAALFGTGEPWLGRAAEKIASKGVDPALRLDGFQPEESYVQVLNKAPAPLVVLAMGMPKQERVARLIAAAGQSCLILCGGAILDFLGEKVARAPVLFRKTGMEWLYRLGIEPKRLFRRYVIGNAVFLIRARRYTSVARNNAA